jgi:hypothetical protein
MAEPTEEYRTGTRATVTKVAASVTAVELTDRNVDSLCVMVFNDSVHPLYLKFGEGATDDDWSVKIDAKGYFESPFPQYRGIITGVWPVANGQARVTEVT